MGSWRQRGGAVTRDLPREPGELCPACSPGSVSFSCIRFPRQARREGPLSAAVCGLCSHTPWAAARRSVITIELRMSCPHFAESSRTAHGFFFFPLKMFPKLKTTRNHLLLWGRYSKMFADFRKNYAFHAMNGLNEHFKRSSKSNMPQVPCPHPRWPPAAWRRACQLPLPAPQATHPWPRVQAEERAPGGLSLAHAADLE